MHKIKVFITKERLFWAGIILLTIIKIITSSDISITRDELCFLTKYQYLNKPIDHPPLLPYILHIINLFSRHISNINVFIHIFTSIIFLLTGYTLYSLTKIMFNFKTAALSTLLLYSQPMLYPIEAVPDIVYMLFYIISVYIFYIVIITKKVQYLYLLGISISLCILSKYQAVLIFPSILLYLFISKKDQYLFKAKELYFIFILPLIIVIPILIWNYLNNWETLNYYNLYIFGPGIRITSNEYNSFEIFLQFIASQVIFYNSLLTYIYRDILFNIVSSYIPSISFFGVIGLFAIFCIYIHLIYLYLKTNKSTFLIILTFSLTTFIACSVISFRIFPPEYSAKSAVIMLIIYLSFISLKNKIIKIFLMTSILVGLIFSITNPIYFLYGVPFAGKINSVFIEEDQIVKNNIQQILQFNQKIDFIVCLSQREREKYTYYIQKNINNYKVIFLNILQDSHFMNRYFDQYFVCIDKKNAIIIIDDVSMKENIIELLINQNLFKEVSAINDNLFFCKEFNLGNYEKIYSQYHDELRKS